MTTTEPTTGVPEWINIDAIFPPELNLRERVAVMVGHGEEVLEVLRGFLVDAVALDDEIEALAWPTGCPDDFGLEVSRPLIGADALDDLFMVLAGLAVEANEGVTTPRHYRTVLDRFGIQPLRERDENGQSDPPVSN